MTKSLDLHNAEIRTASVEIRALTISGKQVTLSVFRQLREGALVEDDGTLNGLPWGIVNYHPDKVIDDDGWDIGAKPPKLMPCANAEGHLHVVWQMGAELRRSLVFGPYGRGLREADWHGPDDPERVAYRETYKKLLELPQLFIAI